MASISRPMSEKSPRVSWKALALLVAACTVLIASPARAGSILYVYGNSGMFEFDYIMVDIMTELGHTVTAVASEECETSQAEGKALVYISNSAYAADVGTKFKGVAVPVMSNKFSNWITAGLILDGEGSSHETSTLTISNSSHPMAAGFSGTVSVFNSSLLAYFGKVGGDAQVVAAKPGDADRAALFGYEVGGEMSDESTAPARRVGIFLYDLVDGDLTTTGREIIKAAIGWCMSNSPPNITQHPLSQTIRERQSGFFGVGAYSTLTLSYQWLKDGSPISGATLPTYMTGGSSLEDSGSVFRCVITNSAGSDTSNPAILHVVPRPTPKTSELISVAGELNLSDGTPVGEGTPVKKDVTIKLYPAVTGGSSVHTETFLAVNGKAASIKDGRFVVRLGMGNSTTEAHDILPSYPDMFAEFAVGDSGTTLETLSPRIPVTSPAYTGSIVVLRGIGAPLNPAQIGTMYEDVADNSVWLRMAQNWIRISD